MRKIINCSLIIILVFNLFILVSCNNKDTFVYNEQVQKELSELKDMCISYEGKIEELNTKLIENQDRYLKLKDEYLSLDKDIIKLRQDYSMLQEKQKPVFEINNTLPIFSYKNTLNQEIIVDNKEGSCYVTFSMPKHEEYNEYSFIVLKGGGAPWGVTYKEIIRPEYSISESEKKQTFKFYLDDAENYGYELIVFDTVENKIYQQSFDTYPEGHDI